MEQRAEGRGNCYMSEKKEKSLEFWLFVDEETYGAKEIYRLLLSLVRLLIYCKVSFFFLLISLVEWLEKCFLGFWCFNLLRMLYTCQCPRCPAGTVCIFL